MVAFKKVLATSMLSASAIAQDAFCLVNGQTVAVVDFDTGVCPFTLPASLPAIFDYKSPNDYNVEFYYSLVRQTRYFTDIEGAGHEIDIPAKQIYGLGSVPIFQVHAQKTPSSNSTEGIRRRLMKETLIPRDEASDFANSLKGSDGTQLPDITFEVVLSAPSSGVSVTTPPATVTSNGGTSIVTITSCSDNKCVETTVPATPSVVVTTEHETVTTYTTWCPLTSTETDTATKSTKVITVTSCSDNKCHETTVKATPSVVVTTEHNTVTSYTTWCPETSTETATHYSTKLITVTSCHDNKCHETTVPATPSVVTTTTHEKETIYTTWCPITVTATPVVPVVTTVTPPAGGPVTVTVTPETPEVPVVTVVTPPAGGPVTITVTPEVPVLTTVYPEVPAITTVTPSAPEITVTVCSEEKCHPTVVSATPAVLTTTSGESTVTYTTWCPVVVYTSEGSVVASNVVPVSVAPVATTVSGTAEAPAVTESTSIYFKTVTSCSEGICSKTAVPTTVAFVTTSSGVAPVSIAPTANAPTAAVTIPVSQNAGAASKASALALLVIPLAYFF